MLQAISHLFFVMEHLNGGDLLFHIQVSGRFPNIKPDFTELKSFRASNSCTTKESVYRYINYTIVVFNSKHWKI
ncbi:hypothetical protein NQ314_018192 [Rhamnusium bicolor]|uniref:Uncharacterized protein n=1 Tax=Rhamnusium bicolor TaxID=1586634 RepID=A0AAV8WRT9_9CUCU|nr:hypothetical protein NQ314_018192 [Rhamnusium bicolor]